VVFIFSIFALGAQGQGWPKYFLMMFENHGYNQVTANSGWNSIIKNGLSLTNYHAVSHPSEPNYVAQIAGSFYNITNDANYNLPYKNVVDLLDAHGHTWKAYQEDYQPKSGGDCNTVASEGTYYRKHNPFMSFTDITGNLTRCQLIVNETVFSSRCKSWSITRIWVLYP